MTATLHFLELRRYFADHELQEPFHTTVAKLTEIWHCTPRYSKLIIRKLCGLGLVQWQAGQGRGNTSLLTLVGDFDNILLRESKLRMEEGNVTEAMELMNRFGGYETKERFRNWLSEQMGFSTRTVLNTLQDTLQFPVYRKIFTLDPGRVYYAFDCHVAGQLFNTLVEYNQEQRKVVPCIAHSWECSGDAREWIFHLRKGVMFHHGRELTADDVIFTLNRFLRNPGAYEASWMFQDIEGIEAIDSRTVRIRLQEPNYLFLRFLCTVQASVVPEDVMRNKGAEFELQPVGTGSFRMVRLDEGICSLEAFQTHFRGRPHLDRVEILIFSGVESGYFGEPDWTVVMSSHGDTSQKHRKVLGDGGGVWLDVETLFSCCNLLVFNQDKKGVHNRLLFRQVLDHIIDRERIISELGEDRIHPAYGFRYQEGGQVKGAESSPKLDDSQLISLLAASGYRGEIFRLAVGSFHYADALWIQKQAERYGIKVEVEVIDRIEEGEGGYMSSQHDARLFGSVLGNDEVSELQMYLQKNYLLSAFDQPTFEAVNDQIRQILREEDEGKRQHGLAALEQILRDTTAVLFLVHKKSNASHHESVRGVSINAYGWLDFHTIWFHPQGAHRKLVH
ncbi:ABC transporter substrate-binding protein [Paenibacillus sp. PK3_47]|nr:ABC transporter substrate-binding protein [Paenibacillus sp. PK3_47]